MYCHLSKIVSSNSSILSIPHVNNLFQIIRMAVYQMILLSYHKVL